MRNGLRAYAAEPVERRKQRLLPAVDQLRDSLDRTTAGAGWKTYFQLDEIDKLAQSSDELDGQAAATLREIISRFDQTSDSPDYLIVPQMAGFSATRDSLAQLADRMEQLADSQPRDADDMDRVATSG